MAHTDHSPPFSTPVHFQIPSFVCSAAPTLAPGGGAEVLPVSLLSDNPLATTWFSNNGFTPHSYDDRYPSAEQRQPSITRQLLQGSNWQPQQAQSLSAPFDFDSYIVQNTHTSPPASSPPQPRTLTQAELSAFIQPQQKPSALLQPSLASSELPAPSPLGLPVYSASGFDLLSILARVANRPHPRVVLGPVDLTCSFVVVDVRRHDHPIVYCSPTFCHLTGYAENEVLGRNCRFLQAPSGQVQRGEHRHHTSHDAVVHLKKNLSADKECQTSIVNYRKDGTAFINLVTVIPILGGVSGAPHEESDVVYHVGFQVDLTKQPNAILEKLRDGSYVVDYSSQRSFAAGSLSFEISGQSKDRKTHAIPSVRISKDLKKLLHDPSFVRSIPISSSTTIPPSQPSSSTRNEAENSLSVSGSNQLLHLLLLEASPDFIYVVSLKGNFLYVAPSVRRVLGYEPEEMVGGSISDFAHPEDVVPLMRELKEGSATGLAAAASITAAVAAPSTECGPASGSVVAGADHSVAVGAQMAPRTVDLLFRARTKAGAYVWVESKGRLYPEPGKGRKAIVLCARAKEMLRLGWRHVVQGGGLGMPAYATEGGEPGRKRQTETEVWGMMMTGLGSGAVSFSVVGVAVTDLLGWVPSELIGREVIRFVTEGAQDLLEQICLCERGGGAPNPRRVFCRMQHKDGSSVDTFFVLYRPVRDISLTQEIRGITPVPLIYRLCLAHHLFKSSSQSSTSLVHPLGGDVFEELDTGRDSSWQYELQQVRFANQRLEEEISVLEKQLDKAGDVQQKVLNELQRNPQPQIGHYAQADPSLAHVEPSLSLHQHLPRTHEPLPHSTNAPLSHHYPSLPLGSFMHSAHPQSNTAPITMPTSNPVHPPLPYNWDPSAQNPGQNYTRTHGLKRSWDVATN